MRLLCLFLIWVVGCAPTHHVLPADLLSERELTEYVNRVGKRIVLISDHPNEKYHFVVRSERRIEIFHIDTEIIVSKGLLAELTSEAELAAILCYVLARPISSSILSREQQALEYMSYAGYTPRAAVVLQKRLLPLQEHFSSTSYPLSTQRLEYSQRLVEGYPQGLKEHKDTYQPVLRLLRVQNYLSSRKE